MRALYPYTCRKYYESLLLDLQGEHRKLTYTLRSIVGSIQKASLYTSREYLESYLYTCGEYLESYLYTCGEYSESLPIPDLFTPAKPSQQSNIAIIRKLSYILAGIIQKAYLQNLLGVFKKLLQGVFRELTCIRSIQTAYQYTIRQYFKSLPIHL